MASSYLIFPSLEERIQTSGLIGSYPDTNDFLYIEDDASDSYVNDSFTRLSNRIKNSVGEQWNKAIQDSSAWHKDGNIFLPRKGNDLLLATGEFLEGVGIPEDEIFNFDEYGFYSILDFIMSLSAYRLSSPEDCYEGIRVVRQWQSQNLKTILGIGGNGETKIFQEITYGGEITSPFGNRVLFMPRELTKLNETYNDESVRLFAIFLRFAYEEGVLLSILGDNKENPELNLKARINSNGIGSDDFTLTNLDANQFLRTEFGDWTHGIPHLIGETGVTYNFTKVGNTLRVKTISQGEYDGREMIFSIEDCRDIILGLIELSPHPGILLNLLISSKNL